MHDLIPWIKRAGLVATTLAAAITAQFGWALGETIVAKISLAGLLALCTYVVGYALSTAYDAWQRGLYGVSAAAAGLFSIAVCVEFVSHAGFTASHRDGTIKQASMQTTSHEDARATILSLQSDIKRLGERVRMTPQQPAGEAEAVIDAAHAHKWWRATAQCTSPKGPQTRTWCDAFRAAEATLKGWADIRAAEAGLSKARIDLAAAEQHGRARGIGHAAAASQGVIMASVMTATERPDSSAVYWAGLGISSLLALFAIAVGSLSNLIAYALDGAGTTIDEALRRAREQALAMIDAEAERAMRAA